MESESVDNSVESSVANSDRTTDAGAPKTPGNTGTAQAVIKSTESVQVELEVDKHKDSPSLSKTEIPLPQTSAVEENVAKTSHPEPIGKSMIADRIAFEEPIVTDIEVEVPILTDNVDFAKPTSIFTEETGPTFYKINSNLVTPPIRIKNLPEQFASLRVLGAPKKREDLSAFYIDKIRDFVGEDLTDEEFEKLAKYCSPDHLRTGAELSMPVRAPTHGLLTNDSEERLALERSTGFSGNTSLCIYKKYQLRVDKDLGNHYSKKLKYRGIRLMPLVSEDGKTAAAETKSPDLEAGKDLLLRVRVYRPYDYNIKYFRLIIMQCCVSGCTNTSKKQENGSNSVKFYVFPKNSTHHPWLHDKRKKWINAVMKHTKHPNDFLPTRNTRICSAHFFGNKKSEHPYHPSYVPTIFPGEEKNPQEMVKQLERFERHRRTAKLLEINKVKNSSEFSTQVNVQPENLAKRSVGCQSDDLLRGDQIYNTHLFCSLLNINGVCTAEIQTNMISKKYADKSCEANIPTTVEVKQEFNCDPLDITSIKMEENIFC